MAPQGLCMSPRSFLSPRFLPKENRHCTKTDADWDHGFLEADVCAICLCTFHDPHILRGCGHTFCLACIQKLPAPLCCPTCRHTSAPGEKAIPNFALRDLLGASDMESPRRRNSRSLEQGRVVCTTPRDWSLLGAGCRVVHGARWTSIWESTASLTGLIRIEVSNENPIRMSWGMARVEFSMCGEAKPIEGCNSQTENLGELFSSPSLANSKTATFCPPWPTYSVRVLPRSRTSIPYVDGRCAIGFRITLV